MNGRLQEQFYYFDNSDYAPALGTTSNFFIRRARIEARGHISENVVGLHPAVLRGRPEPLNATTTCTSAAVPAGGGTPAVTCTHHRPERASAA